MSKLLWMTRGGCAALNAQTSERGTRQSYQQLKTTKTVPFNVNCGTASGEFGGMLLVGKRGGGGGAADGGATASGDDAEEDDVDGESVDELIGVSERFLSCCCCSCSSMKRAASSRVFRLMFGMVC